MWGSGAGWPSAPPPTSSVSCRINLAFPSCALCWVPTLALPTFAHLVERKFVAEKNFVDIMDSAAHCATHC
eukprot:m.130785 g.130785  ORF g.130785 m.130785 type:complete len:71 (-) comp13729_c0_seq1:1886-2098(-)